MVNKKTLKLIEMFIEPSKRDFFINYCNKFEMEAVSDELAFNYLANPIFKKHFIKLAPSKALKYFTGSNHVIGRNVKTVDNAVDVSKMKKDHTRFFKSKNYDLYFFVSSTYAMWSWNGSEPLFEQAKILFNPIFLNYIGNVDFGRSFGAFGSYYGESTDLKELQEELTLELGFVPFWLCE